MKPQMITAALFVATLVPSFAYADYSCRVWIHSPYRTMVYNFPRVKSDVVSGWKYSEHVIAYICTSLNGEPPLSGYGGETGEMTTQY